MLELLKIKKSEFKYDRKKYIILTYIEISTLLGRVDICHAKAGK